jgi:hypothetical protein
MVLNLISQIHLIAFQQVFNTVLFVTKVRPAILLSMVMYTFEIKRANQCPAQ